MAELPMPAELEAKVLADRAQLLHAHVPGNMLGSISAALVAAWMLSDGLSRAAVGAWLAAQFALCALALFAARRVRQKPTSSKNAARRVRAVARGSLLFGLVWAAGVFLFWQPGGFEQQALLMFLIVGLTSGALHAQMASHRAFLAFFLPCLVSVLVCAAAQPSVRAATIMLSVLVYGAASARVAVLLQRTLIDSLRRRHEIEALAADLRLQKDKAEEANLSKSRFLAAASHDLRQPVHALALLTGALQQRPLEPEAARLAGLLHGTVGGMGRMFNGLLDISKLDAGAVQAHLCAFELAPLLGRVVADESPLAQAKGLELRLRCPPLRAFTDPLLLERILRNVLANAVRYTTRGGVLVAARAQGSHIVLRVVDTGVGIAPHARDAVFGEFVQLHNRERDPSQGFGLGLSIVKRLTQLLGIPLALRSREGRGTTITLRLAQAANEEQCPPSTEPHATQTEQREARGSGLVLVIDDDAATRLAMEALIQGWGFDVLSASGMASLGPRLLALRAPPVLVISDLRLRGQENGIEEVEQLREGFNEAIPALIITGDTGADRLDAVRESGLTLLHKPVAENALRQAIDQALHAPSTEP